MKYAFILPHLNYKLEYDPTYIYVGVDRGAILALENKIPLTYAIGDFDSINDLEYNKLRQQVKTIINLPKMKDDTDTEAAIKHFNDGKEIEIYGGLQGKRVEHLYANLNLCFKYPHISFVDNYSKIKAIPKCLTINDNTYHFYSFFADEGSVISLKGFLYPLDNYVFKKYDNLCISNELDSKEAFISFKGKGIMIMSKKD